MALHAEDLVSPQAQRPATGHAGGMDPDIRHAINPNVTYDPHKRTEKIKCTCGFLGSPRDVERHIEHENASLGSAE